MYLLRDSLKILALAGIIILSASGSYASDGIVEKILKTKEFHIGFVVLPPSISKDPVTNKPTGYYVDSVKYIADQMGVEPIFHEETWATFISGLQSGRYDLSIASTVNTIPRSTAVAFTEPLGYSGTCLIVKKDSPFNSLQDLQKKGTRIGVIQGAFMVPWVRATFKDGEIVESTASAFVEPMNVITGRTDTSVTDSNTCRQFVAANPEARTLYADEPLNLTATAWMVRIDDLNFLNFINNAIQNLRSTGILKQFVENYEGTQLQHGVVWEEWGSK